MCAARLDEVAAGVNPEQREVALQVLGARQSNLGDPPPLGSYQRTPIETCRHVAAPIWVHGESSVDGGRHREMRAVALTMQS